MGVDGGVGVDPGVWPGRLSGVGGLGFGKGSSRRAGGLYDADSGQLNRTISMIDHWPLSRL